MAVLLVLVLVSLGLITAVIDPMGGDGFIIEALVVPTLSFQMLDSLFEAAEIMR